MGVGSYISKILKTKLKIGNKAEKRKQRINDMQSRSYSYEFIFKGHTNITVVRESGDKVDFCRTDYFAGDSKSLPGKVIKLTGNDITGDFLRVIDKYNDYFHEYYAKVNKCTYELSENHIKLEEFGEMVTIEALNKKAEELSSESKDRAFENADKRLAKESSIKNLFET